MKMTLRRAAPLVVMLLAACASIPNGPSQMALPGTGRNFNDFRVDDANCRQYATQQLGGTSAQQAQADAAVRSAAVGAIVGALAGAAIDGSHGAGIGAGTGLVFGSLAGSEVAGMSAYDLQRRYDQAYVQCMYGSGHRVPVYGRMTEPPRQAAPNYPPAYPPPGTPPPGTPPPR